MDVLRLCVVVLAALLSLVSAQSTGKRRTLRCYECNVWKAGYGHLCDNPRIVEECTVCMKVFTTIYMGYYKNTPRMSTIETRLCGNDDTAHFSTECLKYQSIDGYNERCYCDTDLCNAATKWNPSSLLLIPSICLTLWKLFTGL